MTVLRKPSLNSIGVVVAIVIALAQPFWAAAVQSGQQSRDHDTLENVARDVRDVRERVARIEGQLTAPPPAAPRQIIAAKGDTP
jgi:hypothetical protein